MTPRSRWPRWVTSDAVTRRLPTCRIPLMRYIHGVKCGSGTRQLRTLAPGAVSICGRSLYPLHEPSPLPHAGRHVFPPRCCCSLPDTPGLYAPVHDHTWDAQVMAFTLLSSSLMLYNSFRTIDTSAIDVLADVGDLAEMSAGVGTGQVRNTGASLDHCLGNRRGARQADGSGSDDDLFVAKLLWVVRDAELEYETVNGTPMTPTQWYVARLRTLVALLTTLQRQCVATLSGPCVPRLSGAATTLSPALPHSHTRRTPPRPG